MGIIMRLESCWFCSSTIYPGHGLMYVRNDGETFKFCRSKCHKSFKKKRDPRKVLWTKAYRQLTGRELCDNTTSNFERRRNRPEKFKRNIMIKTVHALLKIEAIRRTRKDRFRVALIQHSKQKHNLLLKHSTLLLKK